MPAHSRRLRNSGPANSTIATSRNATTRMGRADNVASLGDARVVSLHHDSDGETGGTALRQSDRAAESNSPVPRGAATMENRNFRGGLRFRSGRRYAFSSGHHKG